jgi:hypothetical protein
MVQVLKSEREFRLGLFATRYSDGTVESLADDAQFITVNGAWTKTRAEYLDLMRRLHGPPGPFRASRRETPVMNILFLAPDVAMMHSQFHIYGDSMSRRGPVSGPGPCAGSMADGGCAKHRCAT